MRCTFVFEMSLIICKVKFDAFLNITKLESTIIIAVRLNTDFHFHFNLTRLRRDAILQ